MAFDLFGAASEIATVLPASKWMLVGGLMVHAHAQLAGITHHRPTDDTDLVVELRAASYLEAATALERLGYIRHESLDACAPFHRYRRATGQVDLMAPEDSQVRFAGRRVLAVPGSRSALLRTLVFETPQGASLRIADLASALSLKGAAHQQPGANPLRHLQDAVVLFACAGRDRLELSKSMRSNVNHLLRALDDAQAWAAVSVTDRRRAVAAIRGVRPDWVVPSFVLPQRPSTRAPASAPRVVWEPIDPPPSRRGQPHSPHTVPPPTEAP